MAPFIKRLGAATVGGALGVTLVALAGCGGPPGPETPPSAYEAASEPAAPPELAGGPASPPSQELAGGPSADLSADTSLPPTPPGLTTWRERDGQLVTAMEAIPNPEARSPAERRRTPSDRYAENPRRESARIPGAHPQARQAYPAAQPALKTAPPLPRPITVTPSTPVDAAKPPTPKTGLKTAAPSAPLQTPGQRLATVLSAQARSGSTFTVPDALAQGQTAEVTLSLPTTLLAAIQGEAAKIGLGRAARSTDVVATLSGEGYDITPNGAQTAPLKAGEAARFTWQVKPGAGAKSPLKAQVDGVLSGLRNPIPFPLATLQQPVSVPTDGAKGKLPSFGFLPNGMLAIPGVGALPARSVIGVALVLLAVIVLAILAHKAEAERERAALRRRRALAKAQAASAEEAAVPPPPRPPPPTSTGGHVAPLVAAAAVGAVAATAVQRHQPEPQPGPFPTEARSMAAPDTLPPAEPRPPVQDASPHDKPPVAPDEPAKPTPTPPPRPEQLH